MSFALTNKFTVAAVQEKYMKEDENSDLQWLMEKLCFGKLATPTCLCLPG